LKCEIFAQKQVHATGYILILGGWNNSVTVLARLDEHAFGRLETMKKLVTIGKKHHFVIIRTDATIRWYLDGAFLMSFSDSMPLTGRFFGFNNWESDVYFDDLRIYDIDGKGSEPPIRSLFQ